MPMLQFGLMLSPLPPLLLGNDRNLKMATKEETDLGQRLQNICRVCIITFPSHWLGR